MVLKYCPPLLDLHFCQFFSGFFDVPLPLVENALRRIDFGLRV
jgi:hypothetical protein